MDLSNQFVLCFIFHFLEPLNFILKQINNHSYTISCFKLFCITLINLYFIGPNTRVLKVQADTKFWTSCIVTIEHVFGNDSDQNASLKSLHNLNSDDVDRSRFEHSITDKVVPIWVDCLTTKDWVILKKLKMCVSLMFLGRLKFWYCDCFGFN